MVHKNRSLSVPSLTDRWTDTTTLHPQLCQRAPRSPLPFSSSSTSVFLKHHHLIIALLPYTSSCCCFIAFFCCRAFNKLFYLFVTTQMSLALTAALFNFLTGYLLEGEGTKRSKVTETTENRLTCCFSLCCLLYG